MKSLSKAVVVVMLLRAVCAAPDQKQPPVNRLMFGGDVMLSRHVGRVAQEKQDPAWPFRAIAAEFSAADLAFVNLESPFAEKGPYPTRGMVFRARPEMVEGLRHAGIDIVSTANNHARDAGSAGVAFTYEWLVKNGIAVAGTGRNSEEALNGVMLTSRGVKFGFLAYTYDQKNGNHRDEDPRVAGMDLAAMREGIARLRPQADAVIVSLHAGNEYWKKPTPIQRAFARAAIDAGATVVVGHHPHVTQPVEEYKGGLILYSLGNLIFDQTLPGTNRGLVAEVVFAGGRMVGHRVRPVAIRQTVAELLDQKSDSVASPAGPE